MAEVEEIIHGALARVLAENRDRFNAQFAEAARVHSLKAEDFATVLRRTIAPIVEGVEKSRPERTRQVAEKLYVLALELVGKKLLGPGAKQPLIEEAWRSIFRASPQLVGLAAGQFAGVVTNAIYNLSLTPNARLVEWIETMCEVARECQSLDDFRVTGHVAAWRCGMAHFRESATQAGAALPEKLLRLALQLPEGAYAAHDLEQWRNNPWHTATPWKSPNKGLRIVATPGAFRGFGGPFLTPPRIMLVDGQFIASDIENSWVLHADIFGATFLRVEKMDSPSSRLPRGTTIDPKGLVQFGGEQQKLPELMPFSSMAANERTLAVTVPLSHRIYLLAIVPPTS